MAQDAPQGAAQPTDANIEDLVQVKVVTGAGNSQVIGSLESELNRELKRLRQQGHHIVGISLGSAGELAGGYGVVEGIAAIIYQPKVQPKE